MSSLQEIKVDIAIEVFDLIQNPKEHEQFKPPSFFTRERPVPKHIEIEEIQSVEDLKKCQDLMFHAQNGHAQNVHAQNGHAQNAQNAQNAPTINQLPNVEYEEEEKNISNIEDFYKEFIQKTPEECQEESNFPQKSYGWLKSRHYCITASQFGTAIGVSPYQTPDDLVHEKIYKKFEGNSATEYGNEHENHARIVFCEWYRKVFEAKGYKDITFLEVNLLKFWQCPWVGVSPDGIIQYIDEKGEKKWDLIEYKCPARYKHTQENPYEKFKGGVPPQYMAQIQGIMGFCNLFSEMKFDCAWFIVWLPSKTYIKKVLYNDEYFIELKTRLKKWYFEKYLPMCLIKYQKKFPLVLHL